ncbi:ABC-type branched-chain amino acid transport system, substrate-binding protein [Saccharopolyspora antimicrobica]|uniref:ABC-type branched-chain amino acid transport system, substrate-binding protein n=2 Tax=Saccharopolyspora antimicrobica TaxID=455193 RepID=A0A1I5FJW4_9PSEU|nr:ABC-type branched-subunit amino acid transport system substrate-binding protein [Saccharopolyspora antimicrobica]SFO23601.1 ABC-type branched-chain amino acid transport system, substrate-binding protein [Saccharopolyspora antimicrobica]
MTPLRRSANADQPERLGWPFSGFTTGLMVTAVAAALFLASVYWIYPLLRPCGAGLTSTGDGQCAGVSDGSAQLHPDPGIAAIMAGIHRENTAVEQTPSNTPPVTIGVLIPLPSPGTDDDYLTAVRHDLEGAQLAQIQANHAQLIGDRPQVRLVVANSGENAQHWSTAVSGLIERAPGGSHDQRLVAVVASGRSLGTTRAALDRLTQVSIPVIAARLTADQLTDAPPSPNVPLARVAPTNRDQAAAAAAAVKSSASTAMVIQDRNPANIYADSLGKAFQESFADSAHELVGNETFDGGGEGVATTMAGIVRDICDTRPDVVFFAGRSNDLNTLVRALPSRNCPQQPVRIITGSDAVAFANAVARDEPGLRDALSAQVTVEYTGLAHPEAWDADQSAFPQASVTALRGPCDQWCYPRVYPGRDTAEELADGGIIIGFDAVLTAVTAVRDPYAPNTTPGAVGQALARLHGGNLVRGASGYISLSAQGEAINKAVPILKIGPDGVVSLDRLSAPAGEPCKPRTSPC